MIRRLSDSLVARLKAEMSSWDAEHYPPAPERYAWAHAKASLLVAFEGSIYGEVESMAPQSTGRDVEMSVTILARQLVGDISITSALDQVRVALFGWEPTDPNGEKLGFGPMRPVRESFVSEEDGVWRFVAIYRSSIPVVADVAPLSGAPLQLVTFKEPDG